MFDSFNALDMIYQCYTSMTFIGPSIDLQQRTLLLGLQKRVWVTLQSAQESQMQAG